MHPTFGLTLYVPTSMGAVSWSSVAQSGATIAVSGATTTRRCPRAPPRLGRLPILLGTPRDEARDGAGACWETSGAVAESIFGVSHDEYRGNVRR